MGISTKTEIREIVRKINGVIIVVYVVILILLLGFVGIPWGTGPTVYPLENYPTVEGNVIAVKSESIRLFYLPFLKWKTEFIAYKKPLENGTSYSILQGDRLAEIEEKYGKLNEHIPWRHKYGWLPGASFFLFLAIPFIIERATRRTSSSYSLISKDKVVR